MKRRTFIKTTGMVFAAISLPEMLRAYDAESKLPSFGIITGNTGGRLGKK